jgi:hypothetical protein
MRKGGPAVAGAMHRPGVRISGIDSRRSITTGVFGQHGASVIQFPRRRRLHGDVSPDRPGEPPEDSVIRRVWRLREEGELTETAAEELHGALCGLRDGGRR